MVGACQAKRDGRRFERISAWCRDSARPTSTIRATGITTSPNAGPGSKHCTSVPAAGRSPPSGWHTRAKSIWIPVHAIGLFVLFLASGRTPPGGGWSSWKVRTDARRSGYRMQRARRLDAQRRARPARASLKIDGTQTVHRGMPAQIVNAVSGQHHEANSKRPSLCAAGNRGQTPATPGLSPVESARPQSVLSSDDSSPALRRSCRLLEAA